MDPTVPSGTVGELLIGLFSERGIALLFYGG